MQLGAPVDTAVADFSMQAYLEWHPDIAQAGMNPLMHYLRYASSRGITGPSPTCARACTRARSPSTLNARRS